MSSTPDNEYWLICPVCNKPNPAGTKFCKHCWGAALGSQKPVSSAELEAMIEKRQQARQRRKKILRFSIIGISVLVAVAITIPVLYKYTDVISRLDTALNSSSAPGEWAMFRHDLANSGVTGAATVPQGTIKWTFQTGAAIQSSVAVANGTIYVGSRDGKLYAIDEQTGAQRWAYQTGSWVESSPTVVDGVVYFGSNDGNFYAVDANTGQLRWAFGTTYPVTSSAAVAGGRVYFGSDNYYVYALDAKTGKRLWQFDAKSPVAASPVVANGLVYVGTGSEWVYTLNAVTGQPRLHFRAYQSTYGSPAILGTTALFANFDGFLIGVDGSARNWPWEYDLKPYWIQIWAFGIPFPAPPKQSGLLWSMSMGHQSSSSTVVSGNTVYVAVDDGIVSIDLTTRKKIAAFETDGAVRGTPVVVGTTVITGSEDGHVYAVDMDKGAKGEQLWDVATGGKITASPTLANGVLYVGAHDGILYAIK